MSDKRYGVSFSYNFKFYIPNLREYIKFQVELENDEGEYRKMRLGLKPSQEYKDRCLSEDRNPGIPPLFKNYYLNLVNQFIFRINDKFFGKKEKMYATELCAYWYEVKSDTITADSDQELIDWKGFCKGCSEYLEQINYSVFELKHIQVYVLTFFIKEGFLDIRRTGEIRDLWWSRYR